LDPGLAFGKVLRAVRTEAQLTQEQVALTAGVERIYVSMLETGKRQPTIKVVFKLASALNKRPSELIALTEQQVDAE
jgi:transcriptional regulator with XRE-family HTH domain